MQKLLVRCLRWTLSVLAIGLPAISSAGVWHDLNTIGVAAKGSSSKPCLLSITPGRHRIVGSVTFSGVAGVHQQ